MSKRMHETTFPGPLPGLRSLEETGGNQSVRIRHPGYLPPALTQGESPHISEHQFLSCELQGVNSLVSRTPSRQNILYLCAVAAGGRK